MLPIRWIGRNLSNAIYPDSRRKQQTVGILNTWGRNCAWTNTDRSLIRYSLVLLIRDCPPGRFALVCQRLNALQYSSECQDHAASTLDCEELKDSIGELKAAIMLITGILFVLGLSSTWLSFLLTILQ